ncbi:MAG: U32 family peptidase, partial [Alphaproteobacteria bacterium]|nr:U32 family peptidase [Alphaproteobacteria bacterium]
MKHELLAPAGNIEAGYAALYYGADAVYLGLTKFSARAGAENFTFDELDEFTAYAHSLNRKVFVALNTILTETEIKELPDVFAGLKRCRVDALIIQDLGVFYLAKKLIPEIELHASTQMAVHNAEGARFLYNLGFKRVVLARELTKAEINAIAKAVPEVDLEVFVHGALCYSFSGQCLFSALEFGKSANRGRCAYPCRSAYLEKTGNTEENSHLFSMKDLALEEDVLSLNALSFK